jgi:hypothetical protein
MAGNVVGFGLWEIGLGVVVLREVAVVVGGVKFLKIFGLESLCLASSSLDRPIAWEIVVGLWTAISFQISGARP